MKKYVNAIIEVSNFDLKDVVMASPNAEWYGDQPNADTVDTNPIETDAGDVWSDLFGPNP